MKPDLRTRMGLIFFAFFLLVCASVATTVWIADSQQEDALVINLAGRQRMLVQQMTRVSLEIEKHGTSEYTPGLEEAIATFDTTLWALISGGDTTYPSSQTVHVSATTDPLILTELHHMHDSWDAFQTHLAIILSEQPASPNFETAVQAIERLSPALAGEADDVVRLYQAASEQKLARLRWLQGAFFVSALALLLAGAWVTWRSVVAPLGVLASAVERIGNGDLSTPVKIAGSPEFEALGGSIDTMRLQLGASRQELVDWTGKLEARVARRTQELAALIDVSREISSHLEIDHVLRLITNKARELLASEGAFLCLLDDTQQSLVLGAMSGPQEALQTNRVDVSGQRSQARYVLSSEQALACGIGECSGICGIIAPDFRSSQLAASLQAGDRVIGALCVSSSKAKAFSDDEATLLTKLAYSATIALENARLYQQVEQAATLEERQRIASDIHDGLAQTLTYLELKIGQVSEQMSSGQVEDAGEELEHIRDAVTQAGKEARQSIATLHKGSPLRRSVQACLAEIADAFLKNGGPPVEVVSAFEEPLMVASDESEQVMRVIQEALQNIRRHARASNVVIWLAQQNDKLSISVRDDGQGFNMDTLGADGGEHFGISIMRARAARIGGRITFNSQPGQGTHVTLSWSPSGAPQPHLQQKTEAQHA